MYEFEKIIGKKYALDLNTDRITAEKAYNILVKNGIESGNGFSYNYDSIWTKSYSFVRLDKSCYTHSSKRWIDGNSYIIVSAEDFIRDNTPSEVKFKIGDKVRLAKNVPSDYNSWSFSNWEIGKILTIRQIGEYQFHVKNSQLPVLCFEKDNYGGWCPSYLFELVTNVPIQEDNGEIKVGDEVECLPGFSTDYGVNYGGAGYQEGRKFKVKRLESDIVWFEGSVGGVYTKAVKKVVNNINKQTIKTKQNEERSNRSRIIKVSEIVTKVNRAERPRAVSLQCGGCTISITRRFERNKKVTC